MRVLVTGGLGFIGGHMVLNRLAQGDQVMVVDVHTYAARPEFLRQAHQDYQGRLRVEIADVCNARRMRGLIKEFRPNVVIHMAAESHVCNSIRNPGAFARTNTMGTFTILQALLDLELIDEVQLVHVSTDEVFGDCDAFGLDAFREATQIRPRSPYAASKAASDLFVQAWCHTYGLRAVVTNCSNNFGPNQHEEKLIPQTIQRLMAGEPIRLYGDGAQVRDWLWVGDHVSAINRLIETQHLPWEGERYCVGGELAMTNREMVQNVHAAYCRVVGKSVPVEYVHTDGRPTDDRRYQIDTSLIRVKSGWAPSPEFFLSRLDATVRWYVERAPGLKLVGA